MSELISMSKELKIALGIPLITNFKEFQEIWEVTKLRTRLYERLILTPEIQKFCDDAVRNTILHSSNEYLAIVLSESLKRIEHLLAQQEYKFRMCAHLSRDQYVPDWQGITIHLRVGFRTFHEEMRIWREIEEEITGIIDSFRKACPNDIMKLNEANEVIATSMEKLAKS